MFPQPLRDVTTALELFRRGRFTEAVTALEQQSAAPHSRRRADPFVDTLLADSLQRLGRNSDAERIASRTLYTSSAHTARCHLILGNVMRSRGDITKAIEHFQIAAAAQGGDPETSCWIQLRLMAAIGELKGRDAAIARLDGVRLVLTKHGDPRLFAALHLWFVETDTMRGDLQSARRHLRTADLLLAPLDDVWLRGYLAINSSVVHYYHAEIDKARHWAEIAISCARESGHRTTKRAAYANLGYFEFAVGQFEKAEDDFRIALECCEPGSANEIAILHNIAETKLQKGDLHECDAILAKLDALTAANADAHRRHYCAWALQTRVKLLLRERRNAEALKVSQKIAPLLSGLPNARVTVESQLLSVEALLANESASAADRLLPVICPNIHLAPDLFAEAELVTGQVLAATGSFQLAHTHVQRAFDTFETIGHLIGKERSQVALSASSQIQPPTDADSAFSQTSAEIALDRIRALLELRSRPELFGCEAVSLLRDLKCVAALSLVLESRGEARTVRHFAAKDNTLVPGSEVSIVFGIERDKALRLSFVPFEDATSKLTALSFKRVIDQILATQPFDSAVAEREIVWTSAAGGSSPNDLVFASDAILAVWNTVKQIAPTDVSILITGETGTGKEVIARTIHDHSRRSSMPFLAVNCAAVPKDLLESQLFGHRKGAFSGASDHHQGIVRAANGGTLFLDEIGELPLDMQAKMLRFLEMGEVHPVGDNHPVKVNVRLIFATNGDLEQAVSQNRFRQDLFYRLNVIPIKVPPLRERREEIPVLANLFAQRFATEFAKEPVRFSSTAMELLILYSWPGNIRQLANEVRRLAALAESGACITPDQLSPQLQAQTIPRRADSASENGLAMQVRMDQPLEQATSHLESEMIMTCPLQPLHG